MIEFKITQNLDLERLAKETKATLEKQYADFNKKEVRIGIPDNATNSNGESIHEYARANDFGVVSKNLPARPFARASVKDSKYKKELVDVFKQKGLVTSAGHTKTALNTLISLGKQGVENMLDSILHRQYAPLKDATVKRKGNAQFGIDSGDMYESITYNVVKRDKK